MKHSPYAATPTPPAREVLTAVASGDNERLDARERLFFADLKLASGIRKTTARGRFADLDSLVLALLPPRRPLRILDVGASSGTTTADWVAAFRAAGVAVEARATDLVWYAYLVSWGEALHVLCDGEWRPLQFDVGGRTMPGRPGGRNWMRKALPLLALRLAVAVAGRHIFGDRSEAAIGAGIRVRRLALASYRVRQFPEIQLHEEDVFSPPSAADAYDIIRAANILNPRYFPEGRLRVGVHALRQRLAKGGLLVLCRTGLEGTNHATVFRNSDACLEPVGRLNGGVEIERLVASLSCGPRIQGHSLGL